MTDGLEGRCSILLSYGCSVVGLLGLEPRTYGLKARCSAN